MKISNLLRRIKALKGELAELTTKLVQSFSWIDDDKPDYDFKELVKIYGDTKNQLIKAKTDVAILNANRKISFKGNEITLTAAVHQLQELKDEIAFYTGIQPNNRKEKRVGYEYDENSNRKQVVTEINHYSALTVQERDNKLKSLREDFAELNNLVECENNKE